MSNFFASFKSQTIDPMDSQLLSTANHVNLLKQKNYLKIIFFKHEIKKYCLKINPVNKNLSHKFQVLL